MSVQDTSVQDKFERLMLLRRAITDLDQEITDTLAGSFVSLSYVRELKRRRSALLAEAAQLQAFLTRTPA